MKTLKKNDRAAQPLQLVEPDRDDLTRVYGDALRELARLSGADPENVDIMLQAYLDGALDDFQDEPPLVAGLPGASS